MKKITKEHLLKLIEDRTEKSISATGLHRIRYCIPDDHKLYMLRSASLQNLISAITHQHYLIPLDGEKISLTSNVLIVKSRTKLFGLLKRSIPKLYIPSADNLVCQTSNHNILEYFKNDLNFFQDNAKVNFDELDSDKPAIGLSKSTIKDKSVLLYYVP